MKAHYHILPTSVCMAATRALRVLCVAFTLCALALNAAHAQKQRPQNRPFADYRNFFLGFHIGMHLQDLVIDNQNNTLHPSKPLFAAVGRYQPGFSVGIIANYSPILDLDIRLVPTLHLAETTISFSDDNKQPLENISLRSNRVELPLIIKYSSSRLNNIRPYMLAGPYAAMVIGQKKNAAIKLKPFDYGLKVGVGCDFYLPYFKMSPELSLSFGIPNVIEHNRPDLKEDNRIEYTHVIKRATTRMILFTINFE